MIETAPNETASDSVASNDTALRTASSEASALADCQALIVCLEGGRFVIVRVDENAGPGLACAEKPDLRDLCVDDVVMYRGRQSKVQAVEVYR